MSDAAPTSGAASGAGLVDLDAEVRRLDPDRWLASRFIGDAAARADVIALYAFDAELARAARVASNDLVGEIRLAWWREALDEIFAARPVRRHPAAMALAEAAGRRRLDRQALEALVDARIEALDRRVPDDVDALLWADQVGGSATVLAAAILDPAAPAQVAELAGRAWGLVLLRRGPGEGQVLDPLLRSAYEAARRAAVGYSAAAFPAIACASLIPLELRRGRPSALGKRLRLFAAVAKGGL